MKKFIGILLLSFTGLVGVKASTPYQMWEADFNRRQEQQWNNRQPPTHVKPDGSGGYSWTDPQPYHSGAFGEYREIPQTHSMKPDGSGGYYVR